MKTKNVIIQSSLLLLLYSITLLIIFPPGQEVGASVIAKGGTVKSINLLFVILFMPILIRYFVNVFISPLYPIAKNIKSRRFQKMRPDYRPLVSVIIPAWNEEVGILNTVKSVLSNYYRNLEVIVVNDGSTDSTHEVVEKFIANYKGSRKIKYFSKKNGGKSSALNLGIRKSAGSIIITVDADSAMDKKTVANFVKRYRDPSVMCVAGNVKIGNHKTLIGLMQSIEYLGGFYFKKADSMFGSIYIVGGAAASYRRQVFRKIGLFDKGTSTEDIEMSTRIQQARMKIAYADDAIVYTEGPSDIKSLIKQRLRWKYGRFETFYKYRELFFNIHGNKYLTFFVLPLAVFSEMLLFFEVIMLTALYYYLFTSGNFASLITSIMISAIVLAVQVLSDTKNRKGYYLLLWAPVVWLLFYFIDFIEFNALMRSIWALIRKKKVTWQRWKRVGVYN